MGAILRVWSGRSQRNGFEDPDRDGDEEFLLAEKETDQSKEAAERQYRPDGRGRELAERARHVSVRTRAAAAKSFSRARELGETARSAIAPRSLQTPHLSLVRSPLEPWPEHTPGERVKVASYNVHRFAGHSGRARPDASRAQAVIEEIGADVIALQEVLVPFGEAHPRLRCQRKARRNHRRRRRRSCTRIFPTAVAPAAVRSQL